MATNVPIRRTLQDSEGLPARPARVATPLRRSRRLRYGAVVLLACGFMVGASGLVLEAAALGLVGNAAPAQEESAILAIAGVVRARDSSEPLAGLPVALIQPGLPGLRSFQQGKTTTTDSSGRFLFTGLTPGRYELQQIDLDRWLREGGNIYPGMPVDLAEGALHPPITIWVTRSARISGLVYSADGEPVAGAFVDVLAPALINGDRTVRPPSIVTPVSTDAEGRYSIEAPVGETYFIRVRGREYWLARDGEGLVMDYYYPGTAFVEESIPLDIQTPSDVAGIDIVMRRTEMHRVEFELAVDPRFLDAVANPVEVLVRPLGRGLIVQPFYRVAAEKLSPDGFTTPPLAPGEYELLVVFSSALQEQYRELNWRELNPIAQVRASIVDRPVDLGRIAPAARYDLKGKFNLPEGLSTADLPYITLSAYNFLSDIPVAPRPDGSFEISALFPARYRFFFSPLQYPDPAHLPDGFYIASAVGGGQDVLRDGLRIGDRDVEIEFVIREGAGRIAGTVYDSTGASIPESRVVLIPPLGARGLLMDLRTVVTDGAGNFLFTNLEPGNYRIVSSLSRDLRLGIRYWEESDWLRRFEPRGQALFVEPNREVRINLTLVSD